MHPLAPVNTFWEGPLGPLEEVSLRSFVRNGHTVNFWSYTATPPPIPGVVARDAREVLSQDLVGEFRYKKTNSISPFTNLFRYRLLYDRGGIWADLDNVCLRPIAIAGDEHIFPNCSASYALGRETFRDGGIKIDTWLIATPRGSPLMRTCFERAMKLKGKRRRWGALGPKLLNRAARHHGLLEAASTRFMPINWRHAYRYFHNDPLLSAYFAAFSGRSLTAHLYRRMLGIHDLLRPGTVRRFSVMRRLLAREGVRWYE